MYVCIDDSKVHVHTHVHVITTLQHDSVHYTHGILGFLHSVIFNKRHTAT